MTNTVNTNTQPAVRSVEQLISAWQRLNSEVNSTRLSLEKTLNSRGINARGARLDDAPQASALTSQLAARNRERDTLVRSLSQPDFDVAIRRALQKREQIENQVNEFEARKLRSRQSAFEKENGFANNRQRVQGIASSGLAVANERVTGSGAAQTFGIQTALTANFLVISQLSSALRFTTGFVIEFDKALFSLKAITSSSDGVMAQFRDTIEEVANSTKFTSVEIAQAAQVLGQAGFSAREVQQALQGVAEFAAAVGTDIKKAVDLITSSISVFNLRANEATNVADIFTAAVNQSKLTADQLQLSFSFVSNAASQSKVSISELTTLLAALANAGLRSGSTIGTNLRALFVDLASPSDKLVNSLRNVGLTLDDIDVQSQGVIGVIQNLTAAGFGASEAFDTLETRSAQAFLALSGQADTLDAIQRGLVGTGAASRASDTQLKSLANTLANFKSVFGTLALEAFDPTIRALQALFEATNKLLSVFSENSGLAFGVQAAGLALTGFAAVAGVRFLGRILGIGNSLNKLRTEMVLARTGVIGFSAGLAQVGPVSTIAIGGISALSARVAAFGKVGVAASIGIRGLGSVVGALGGPIGVGILALSALSPILLDNSRKSESLAASFDKAKTSVQDTSARFAEAQTIITGLRNELARLETQEVALNKENGLLQRRVVDLIDSYGELGLSLDRTTATYPEVIAKVKELRDAYLGQAKAAGQASAAANQQLSNVQIAQIRGVRPEDLFGGAGAARRFGLEQGFTQQSVSGNNLRTSSINLNNPQNAQLLFRSLGLDDTASVFGQLGRGAVSRDADGNISGINPDLQINGAINELTEKFGTSNDTILTLIDNLRSLGEDINALKATQESVARSSRSARIAGLQSEDPDVIAAIEQASELNRRLLSVINASRRSEEFTTDRRSAEINLRGQGSPIQGEIESFLDSLREGTILETEDQRKAVSDAVSVTIAQGLGSFQTALASLSEDAIQDSRAIVGRRIKASTAEINGAIEGLRQTRNPQELEAQVAEIDAAIGSLAQKRLTELALSLGLTESQFTLQGGTIKRNDGQGLTVTEQVAVASLNDEIGALRNALLERGDTRREAINQDAIAQLIKSNKTIESSLERELSIGTKRLEAGRFGRDELDAVQERRLEIIKRLTEVETENLELEIEKSRNLSEGDKLLRRQKLQDDQDDRLSKVNADFRNQNRTLPARTFGEAGADILNEIVPDSFERDAANAATTFRDTMLAAADATRTGFATLFRDLVTGTETVGGAFKALATSILESMLNVVSSKLAEQLVGLLLDLAFSIGGGRAGGAGSVPTGPFFREGGLVRMAGGGGVSTRDSVRALLQPGEFVLRKSAVDTIGRDNLEQVNAMGNRTVSKAPQGVAQGPSEKAPDVNVWVISPDQQPPLGPRDIIATISEDITRGGSVKKLIRSVNSGAI